MEELNLRQKTWWKGNASNLPSGCSWHDYDPGSAMWNELSSSGYPKNDTYPICYNTPKK